jgi:TIR domain
MSGDVFVSYASKDRGKVMELVQQLETRGVSIWVDRNAIDASTLWFQEIVDGMENCKAVLLVRRQSPHSLRLTSWRKSCATFAWRRGVTWKSSTGSFSRWTPI